MFDNISLMNSQILFFLIPLLVTIVLFICGFISVLVMEIKSYKLRKSLKNTGYPVENMKCVVLPARNQMANIKDSYGKSMFSFENYMIMSFGKDVLDLKDASIQASISALKKNHKMYMTFFVLTGIFLIISMLMFFVVGKIL